VDKSLKPSIYKENRRFFYLSYYFYILIFTLHIYTILPKKKSETYVLNLLMPPQDHRKPKTHHHPIATPTPTYGGHASRRSTLVMALTGVEQKDMRYLFNLAKVSYYHDQ